MSTSGKPKPDRAPLTLAQLTSDKESQATEGESRAAIGRRLFVHWGKTMGKRSNTICDAKRRRAVEACLKAGVDEETGRKAIDGCKLTPHNMGENDRGRPFNDIALIVRDVPQVERFAETASDRVPDNGGGYSYDTAENRAFVLRQLSENPGWAAAQVDDHGPGWWERYGFEGEPRTETQPPAPE